jgi:hypothetical protein
MKGENKMSKRMKALIAALVAILTLTVSGTVAVLAQDDDEAELDEEQPIEKLDEIAPRLRLFMASAEPDELLSKVADILGMPEDELREAFKEARQEIIAERQEKAFQEFLDRMLEEGLINDDEAAEIEEWWQDKPEALNWALLQKAFSMMRLQRNLTDDESSQFQEMRQNKWQWRQQSISDEAGETRFGKGNRTAVTNQISLQPRIINAVRGRDMAAVALSAGGLN